MKRRSPGSAAILAAFVLPGRPGWPRSQGRHRACTEEAHHMNSRVSAIIRKEFIQIRRDRRTLAIVLVLPVMQLLLLGYAINTVVDHLPMIVLDQSHDADSRAMVAAFENSGYFDVVGYARDRSEVSTAIDAGHAK